MVPFIYFLYAYLFFVAFWALFSVIGLFHLFRFGPKNFSTFLVIFIYVSGSVILTALYYSYFGQIDWQTSQLDFSQWINLSTNTPLEF